MAISYLGVGTAAAANNLSVTPTLPGSLSVGDFMVAIVTARGNGTIGTPSGWTQRFQEQLYTTDNLHKLGIFYRFYQAGDGNPTFTYTGGSSGHTVIGQIFAFRGVDTSNPIPDLGANSGNASAQNIGPITGFTPTNAGTDGCVIVIGHRADDWTSVAALTGDGLTWNEIGEPDSTSGSDAGQVYDYALYSGSPPTITNKTFTVTGGAANTGAGKMISLKKPAVTTPKSLPATEVSVAIYVRKIGKTLGPTEISLPSLGKMASRFRSVIATEISSPTLTTLTTWFRSLGVAAVSSVLLIKQLSKTLAVTCASLASLASIPTHVLTLVATEISSALISELTTFYRVLSVAENSIASLTRKMFLSLSALEVSSSTIIKNVGKILFTAATSVATLQKTITRIALLTVIEISIAMLSMLSTFYRALNATMISGAFLFKKMWQTISAISASSLTLSKTSFFYRSLTTAASTIAELIHVATHYLSLSGIEVAVSALGKLTSHFLTLSVSASGLPNIAKKLWRTLACVAVASSSFSKKMFKTLSLIGHALATILTHPFFHPPLVRAFKVLWELRASKIPLENRTSRIPFETQTSTIPMDIRTAKIPLDIRTSKVPFTSKTSTIPLDKRSVEIEEESRIVKA